MGSSAAAIGYACRLNDPTDGLYWCVKIPTPAGSVVVAMGIFIRVKYELSCYGRNCYMTLRGFLFAWGPAAVMWQAPAPSSAWVPALPTGVALRPPCPVWPHTCALFCMEMLCFMLATDSGSLKHCSRGPCVCTVTVQGVSEVGHHTQPCHFTVKYWTAVSWQPWSQL